MRRSVLFVAFVLSAWTASPVHAAPAVAADLQRFAWMAGAWAADTSGERTEEHWMAPEGGTMLGMNRTVSAGRVTFEFMRIVADSSGIAYLANPAGQAPARFALLESGPRRVVFGDPAHDFPQRILYWMDLDGRLHARIEGTMNGKLEGMDWRWRRMRDVQAPRK